MMKAVVSIVFILSTAVVLTTYGQTIPKLVVKPKSAFPFNVTGESSTEFSFRGNNQVVKNQVKGTTALLVIRKNTDSIIWETKSNLKMSRSGDPKKDTTVNTPKITFATNLIGTVMGEVNAAEGLSALDPFFGFGVRRKNPYQIYFNPVLGSTHTSGETWTEHFNDTSYSMPGLKMGLNIQLRTTGDRKITFDGIVDTLGTKTYRIRTDVASLDIVGEGKGQSGTMSFDGEGGWSTISYYAVSNGMLVCHSTRADATVRMSFSGSEEVAVQTIHVNTVSVRTK